MKFREVRLKQFCSLAVFLSLMPLATAALAAPDSNALVLTASNADANQLLVFNSQGNLIQTIPTQGKGGAGGNSGGIEAKGKLAAVVNFGSKTVSLFQRDGNAFHLKQVIPTASSPLSVAFGADHLFILGTTTVESHRMFGSSISSSADGVVALLKADGSSAQVGVLPGQLIITEKSNVIETANLLSDGAVSGVATSVMNIPSNVNTPFGLITRGSNAYVTIAHADEISLVRNADVLTTTSSGTQHSPCWLTLVGPFLYSSNSPSMTISRFAVYGQKIVQDSAIAAQMNGAPTDIASADSLLAVIDSNSQTSHLSIFSVDEDGNLTLRSAVALASANGVAVVSDDESEQP